MNMNFYAGTVLKLADVVGNVMKYSVDKKSESSRYHDDTLKELDQLDNSSKKERLNMVLVAVTPLIAAGVYCLKGHHGKDEDNV